MTEADAPFTLVVLGDSLAAGYGLRAPLRDAYPGRLQAMCDARGWPVEVRNEGVSGSTSAGGLARLDQVLRPPVDALLLALGGNDALRGIPPEALQRTLGTILQRTRARYPEALLVLAGLSAPALPLAGPLAEVLRRAAEAYRAAFVAAAPLADVFVPNLLEGVAGTAALNQPDRVHPTAEGQALLFATLWAVLETPLEAALARWSVRRAALRTGP